VPPFNGHPEGFSAATLDLLDQGLKQIWREMQIAADAKARAIQQPKSAVDAGESVPLPEPALEPALAAIVK
jgi:hypothetical protein